MTRKPEPHSRLHPTFLGRRLAVSLGVLAVVAGAVLIRSGSAPQRVDPTIAKPKAVLFAVRGAPSGPLGSGIAAFIAVIQPSSRTVGIVPVSGSLAAPGGETLAQMAPTASAGDIVKTVVGHLHVKLAGYVIVDASAVHDVLNALWTETPDWPQPLSPDVAMSDLGWPNAQAPKHASLQVIQHLIKDVPQIQGNAKLLLTEVLQGSNTNLSPYEMFVLVTYINDERITPMSVRHLPKSLIQKQVTQ